MSASKYDIDVDLGAEGTSHRYMVELVGSNKAVLDVGCASGYLAKTLRAFGNSVTGVEYDAAAAKEAGSHTTRVLVADLDHTNLAQLLADETFDVIVFGDVLEHLRDPLPTLRQARELLKPNGYIIVSVPNISHGDVRMSLLLGRFQYHNLGLLDTTHLRFFTRESLRELLADAGLVAAEVRTTKAPLFETELGVRRDEIDAGVVALLERDDDATTYQFVLSAVPHSAITIAESTAWTLQSTEAQLVEVSHKLGEAVSELAAVKAERDEVCRALGEETRRTAALTEEVSRFRAEIDLKQAAGTPDELVRASAQSELQALQNTRTFRWRAAAIRILGRT